MFSKKFSVSLIFSVLALFVGCGSVQVATPVCDAIPDGSYSVICQLADKIGTTPETAAAMLKVANTVSLAADVYTAQQASLFVSEMRKYINTARDQGVTFAVAYAALEKKYGSLPAKVQSAFVSLEDVLKIDVSATDIADIILSDYDYVLLLKHLDAQDRVIAPFLIAE